MDDLDDGFIPLAPPTKRLKRNSTASAKKTSPKPRKPTPKHAKETQIVEVVDLDSSESPRDAEKTPNSAKLEFLDFVKTPSPNPPGIAANDTKDDDEEDYDDVEFGDMPDEPENGLDSMDIDEAETAPKVKSTEAIELSISAPKREKEEKEGKKEKKTRPKSDGPRKRRGSVAERDFALQFHNSQLLGWLGHAIRVRREIEENKWHQAIMVSLLPFPLFEELSALRRSDPKQEKSAEGLTRTLKRLLKWFHLSFTIVEPIQAPIRKEQAPAPSRAKLAAGAAPKGKGDPAATYLGNKTTKPAKDDDVIRRFTPQLFHHWTIPKVTQRVAFRAFATILQSFDLNYRMVWHLDKLLVPHKFADFEFVVPSVRYSPRFFARVAQLHLKDWRRFPRKTSTANDDDHQADIPEEPPFLWFEFFSQREDRFITLDLYRSRVDTANTWNVPTSKIGSIASGPIERLSLDADDDADEAADNKKSPPKLKRKRSNSSGMLPKAKLGSNESAYIFGVGRCGRLALVSPLYANSYSEPLAAMGDWKWVQEMVKDWNARRAKSEEFEDDSDVNTSVEERMVEVQEEEIAQIAETEPKPTSKAGYQHHPLYVLKEHLLQFEMLRPDTTEPDHLFQDQEVYSRSQVGIIHTADKWIQYGMQVRAGESCVTSKIKRSGANWDMAAMTWVPEEEAEMSDYFGDWQIEPYVPPVAKDGMVPKNKYGNVYLFKNEMMPIGCIRIQGYPAIDKTAKRIGVDIAPAMVGWTVEAYFSLPKLEGFIICEESHDTLIDAWLEDNVHREAERKRKQRAQIAQIWISLTKQLLLQKRLDENEKNGTPLNEGTEMDVDLEDGPKKRAKATKKTRAKSTGSMNASMASTQHVHNFVSAGAGKPRVCECGYEEEPINRL